jgi:hypothetical protein
MTPDRLPTWTPEAIREFERNEAPRPQDRTAHRAVCVDDEGAVTCICRNGGER